MIDLETFRTIRDVMGDAVCQSEREPAKPNPGLHASLSKSEVITLALWGPWVPFPRERAWSRYTWHHLHEAFPPVPNRSQGTRHQRALREEITAGALFLVQLLQAQDTAYEVLERTAAVTRDAKRRGSGWLAGQADIGWSHRVGWSEGFHLRLSVTKQGVRTGLGFGRWPCTMFVSGSTCNAMKLLWPLPNSLHGEHPLGIHTKR